MLCNVCKLHMLNYYLYQYVDTLVVVFSFIIYTGSGGFQRNTGK